MKNDIKLILVKFFEGNMSNDMFTLKNEGTHYKDISCKICSKEWENFSKPTNELNEIVYKLSEIIV